MRSTLAKLSDIAYDKDVGSRKRKASEVGFNVDDELSNDLYTTYVDGSGEAVVAYRGTRDLIDWKDNVSIATGLHSLNPRFKEAEEVANKAKRKYKKVRLTGHSLGGKMADHVNSVSGLEADVFNPGTSPILPPGFGESKNSNIRVHRNQNDWVSSHGRMNARDGLLGLVRGAHGLKQFM
jgi:hypothetical protein